MPDNLRGPLAIITFIILLSYVSYSSIKLILIIWEKFH